MSRRGLALVLVLFCLPLFVGLRSLDLETDEAIYSFAVDRILEIGDWLQPKYSPNEHEVFLEKPPLKFWIVAAPIKAGLLPHDEFGLRFWDAVAGSAAFLYVFAIGCLLAGPVCGGVSVLLLFVHGPLIFEHGLRTNNMEGTLFLSYCGGIYHFLRWARVEGARAGWHAVAVALYFVLGFMTKFVAAIFLPAVIGGAMLLVPDGRRRLAEGWKTWLAVSGLALALIVPWFVYAQWVFGAVFWHTILEEHVYARFTTGLNPQHLEPWNFYFVTMFEAFRKAGVQWIVVAGSVVLAVQSVRRRSLEGTTVCLWMLPLALISVGSSKLYHYAYPFVPPFALAAGYLLGLIALLAPMIVRRGAGWIEDGLARALPRFARLAARPWVATLATLVIAAAAALAVATLVLGSVKLSVGRAVLIRNASLVRPVLAMVLFGLLARRSARVAAPLVLLLLAALLPIGLYEQTFPRLVQEKHPLRDIRDCVLSVQARSTGQAAAGLYYDGDGGIWHPIYYYLRRVQPWTIQDSPNPARLERALHDTPFRPSLVQETRYRTYLAGPDAPRFAQAVSPPIMELLEQVLLLPGPYESCSSQASLHLTP